MPEPVNRVHPEDHRNIHPGMLNRITLNDVVLVGPVRARVAGNAALARGVGRDLGAAGQDRAGLLLDQDLRSCMPRAGMLKPVFPAQVSPSVPVIVVTQLLVHLAHLLGQGHPAKQVVDPRLDGKAGVEVGRSGRAGGCGRRRCRYRGSDQRDGRKGRARWPPAAEQAGLQLTRSHGRHASPLSLTKLRSALTARAWPLQRERPVLDAEPLTVMLDGVSSIDHQIGWASTRR